MQQIAPDDAAGLAQINMVYDIMLPAGAVGVQ
jgi:hypothetical protein